MQPDRLMWRHRATVEANNDVALTHRENIAIRIETNGG